MTVNEQITHLNETIKAKIGPSKIHGVGVVAIRDIFKGQKAYVTPNRMPTWYKISWNNLNKLLPPIEALIKQRWASIVNGSMFLSPNDDAWLILYMNHSDDPNYDNKTDLALRDIKEGEELTENYCNMDNAHIAYPDLCPKND